AGSERRSLSLRIWKALWELCRCKSGPSPSSSRELVAPESCRKGGIIGWADGRSQPSLSRPAETGAMGASSVRRPRLAESGVTAVLEIDGYIGAVRVDHPRAVPEGRGPRNSQAARNLGADGHHLHAFQRAQYSFVALVLAVVAAGEPEQAGGDESGHSSSP